MTAILFIHRIRRPSDAIERTKEAESTDVRVDVSRSAPPATRIAPADIPCATLFLAALTMAAPQPLPADQRRHRRTDPPRLIVADAAVALVDRWKAELAVLRRRSPASDAVKTLADCVRELVDAISAGHALTVQLTIGEARVISHIPASTLRWLCKNKPDVVGATKREGVWYIDRFCFERYLASPDLYPDSLREAAPDEAQPTPADPEVRLATDSSPDLRLELR